MKRILLILILSIFNWSCSTTPKKNHLGQDMIPLKDFFKNSQVRSYSISPNGKYLAFLKPYKKRMNIFVEPVDRSQKAKRITSQTSRDIAGFFWKENSTLLYIKDFGGDENFHVFRVSIDGKNERDLTPFKETKVYILDDLAGIDEDHILISMNKRDKKVMDAYRLNIKTGDLKMVAQNPGNYSGWLTDHKGKLRVATVTDGVNTAIMYRDKEGQKFRQLIRTNFKDSIAPLFFTADNKNIYVSSNLGRDKRALQVYNPRSKKIIKTIYARKDVDVSRLYYSKKKKRITRAVYTTWKSFNKFFDKETENIYKDLTQKLPGVEISLSSKDRAEDNYVVRTYSDRSLGSYYLYNVPNKKLVKIIDVSPWLKSEQLVEMKPIKYKSRDGLTIHGYLSLPHTKEAKNLPLVVIPHGGPWARDYWGYRPDVQFLANRGYAVLQMNFRGSTGYGKKFWKSSFKQWGAKMQDDVTDGVRHVIAQGIVNKDKVCIYGGSYGGYAVLAGLTYTPDLYACGVDYVGVSNLFTFMETIPPYWTQYLKMLYEMVGHPEKDKERLTQYSPALNVEKIKAPLMVVQGAKDPRVKKSESDQIVEALRKRGVDVPYMVKENEGHGFRNEENKLEMYSKMEKFLGKYLL